MGHVFSYYYSHDQIHVAEMHETSEFMKGEGMHKRI
jgi:hypothetical protein